MKLAIGHLVSTILCLGAVVPHLAWSKPFTCAELGNFAESIAGFRDRGVPLSTSKEAVTDGRLAEIDKRRFLEVVETIYASPNISPYEWSVLAIETCKKTRRKR